MIGDHSKFLQKTLEPTEFVSMRKAAKAIGMSEGSIRYAKRIEKLP